VSAFNDLPLTGGDLRVIADALDEVEATTLAANRTLGRIEVYRPVGEDVIGWVQRFIDNDPDMGWGFVPEASE
jgi:hypothetical protein